MPHAARQNDNSKGVRKAAMRIVGARKTQLRVLVMISVTVTALAASLLGGCGGSKATTHGRSLSGALPTLKVGDTWTEKCTSEGESSTAVSSVTGYSKVGNADVYVLHGTFQPAMFGVVSTINGKMDKQTSQMLEMDSIGTTYSLTITTTYSFSGSPMFPLRVGNSSEVTETDKIVRTVNGETETITETHKYVYKVEKIESVSVPAGTFECFKQVKYESGKVMEIDWVSPDVKLYDVKSVDNDTPMTTELLSYSLK
jgi:hypothetical protein